VSRQAAGPRRSNFPIAPRLLLLSRPTHARALRHLVAVYQAGDPLAGCPVRVSTNGAWRSSALLGVETSTLPLPLLTTLTLERRVLLPGRL